MTERHKPSEKTSVHRFESVSDVVKRYFCAMLPSRVCRSKDKSDLDHACLCDALLVSEALPPSKDHNVPLDHKASKEPP
ncbi:hypothetical protein V2J09_019730 [Rumex salicifolius]